VHGHVRIRSCAVRMGMFARVRNLVGYSCSSVSVLFPCFGFGECVPCRSWYPRRLGFCLKSLLIFVRSSFRVYVILRLANVDCVNVACDCGRPFASLDCFCCNCTCWALSLVDFVPLKTLTLPTV
jgi:hypothetical protein